MTASKSFDMVHTVAFAFDVMNMSFLLEHVDM